MPPEITPQTIVDDFLDQYQEDWELTGQFRSPRGSTNSKTQAAEDSFLMRAARAHWGPDRLLRELRVAWPADYAGTTGINYGNHPDGTRYMELVQPFQPRHGWRYYLRLRTARARELKI